MTILGIDTSAKVSTTALSVDGNLLGEFSVHAQLTHSQTIMPMVDTLLDNTKTAIQDVDLFAVSRGPGSFTGLRIGISLIKAMAMAGAKPCMGISTLEALAYNCRGFDALICPAMDARRDQVYTALFSWEDNLLVRKWEDSALSLEELRLRLEIEDKSVIFVGDGAHLGYDYCKKYSDIYSLAPEQVRYQSAASVCALARQYSGEKDTLLDAAQLSPSYLRLSQAERQRKERQ